jgi:hypothetical protein
MRVDNFFWLQPESSHKKKMLISEFHLIYGISIDACFSYRREGNKSMDITKFETQILK